MTEYIQKTAEQILAETQLAFKNTFGSSVNLTPSSINGVFIQELANIGIATETTRALLMSQIYNPNFASDKYLDGLCAFHQITRINATPSVVTCKITGLSGVVIPTGSQILNTNGDIFTNPLAITIPDNGTIDAEFHSLQTGAIPCDQNSLNRIVQSISGWDTVNNYSDGMLGTATESDNNLRSRRKNSVYLNSAGSLKSIISALENSNNINDYNIDENFSTVDKITQNVTISPQHIYLCVDAPESAYQDIAEILYSKKSAGCALTGNINVTYTDPDYPWVTYHVQFDIAIPVQIEIHVSVLQNNNMTDTIIDEIKNALLQNFTGADGSIPVQMGTPFYSSRFYTPIIQLGIYDITQLTIGVKDGVQGQYIALDFNQIARLQADNIYVTLVQG